MLPQLDDQPILIRSTIVKTPRPRYSQIAPDEPWYRLCAGETGRRILWLSAEQGYSYTHNPYGYGPRFAYTSIPQHPSDRKESVIVWSTSNEDLDQPALWGLPVLDFDEALGLTVVGNCFGELAIYDHVGQHLERCSAFALDFTHQDSNSSLMTTLPISLDLSIVPPEIERRPEFDPSVTLHWSQDPIDRGRVWRTEWANYPDWDRWQGVAKDWAWIVEHAYGFPGLVVPQAYINDDGSNGHGLLFRIENRYLVFAVRAETKQSLKSWPVFPSIGNRVFAVGDAQPESHTSATAITVGNMYRRILSIEMSGGALMFITEFGTATKPRNRWAEQAERGGRPQENLFVKPAILDFILREALDAEGDGSDEEELSDIRSFWRRS
ncbi:hypothetical protein C8R45DRAFT_250588 [Mycena sanguinolenta]|nr:hypothetical protein C8R45DRAFT_250588 [Mycena sanguinolenta]